MASFRLIEHTADIGIEAIADEREGLAEQCGLGLALLLFGDATVVPTLSRKVVASGNTPEETLVNWLNELLFFLIAGEFIPAEITISHFTETEISAEIKAGRIAPDKNPTLREIKAVTHHQTLIGHDGNFWQAQVYVDV